VGLVIVVVGGVVVVGSSPLIGTLLAGLGRFLAADAGFVLVRTVSGTAIAAVALLFVVEAIGPDYYSGDPSLIVPQIVIDPVTGLPKVEGETFVQQWYDRSLSNSMLEGLDSNIEEDLEWSILLALSTCAQLISIEQAQQIIDRRFGAGAPVLSSRAQVVSVGDDNRHACELVPFYVPGAITQTKGRSIPQSTAHVNEALYATPPVAAQPHVGLQPVGQQPQWHFLNRAEAVRDYWYKQPTTYNCAASVPNACDEWPWAATIQGGAPSVGEVQPHLRIIDGTQNSVGGREYQYFADTCGVSRDDHDLFFVAPVPLGFLGAVATDPVASSWIPSFWHCGDS